MKYLQMILLALTSILVLLIICKTLGFSFNKEHISFDVEQCISGQSKEINGCIFWMRHNELEQSQAWRSEYEENTSYCLEKYGEERPSTLLYTEFQRSRDPKCNYESFREQKRNENWTYLISSQKDGYYDFCVKQFCNRPSIFK